MIKYKAKDSLKSPRFAGVKTFMRMEHVVTTDDIDFAVVGIPYDTCASFRVGTRLGPAAIRDASALAAKPFNGPLNVGIFDWCSGVDYGDLGSVPGYIEESFELITEGMLPFFEKGIVPVAMGGDHSVTLPELRACSYSLIRHKRVAHVMGVEEEAVKLAKFWGADPELARHAGILHDCTKYLELAPQLHLCAKYGIELDALEQKAVKLLHSKTGACMARYVFGEPDEVYEAIFWHTTGKADMTLLDKILYMADYIEPNRDFEGVERLRRLAYTDLDQAMLLGVESTIREMEERGVPVHINTIQARQWLLDRGVKLEE